MSQMALIYPVYSMPGQITILKYFIQDNLLNKRDELLALITKNQFDIVVITEVLPKNRDNLQINIVEFSVSGYNRFSTDLGVSNGRGIII